MAKSVKEETGTVIVLVSVSPVLSVITAVLRIDVPLITSLSTRTVMVSVPLTSVTPLPGSQRPVSSQITAPVPPTSGALCGGGLADTKVVLIGVVSLTTILSTASSPAMR